MTNKCCFNPLRLFDAMLSHVCLRLVAENILHSGSSVTTNNILLYTLEGMFTPISSAFIILLPRVKMNITSVAIYMWFVF